MILTKLVKKEKVSKNPPLLLFLMYLYFIVLGTILLMLPISSKNHQVTGFLDALFTATSALCVTGLTTLTTASYWSGFGKLIIITLIQLGGLGIMTGAASVAIILKRKISIRDRMFLAEEKNTNTLSGMVKLLLYIIKATFIIEATGALFLSFRFIPEFGILKGLAYSVFHSISAFCNAGFDLIGGESLSPYVTDPLVSITIMTLIILGGLGYGVYKDLSKKEKLEKLALHTKIVLTMTLFLILLGSLLFMIIEWNNPDTIGNMNFFGKILAATFQSVTLRTAGFFSIPQNGLRQASAFLGVILMFIGGSPAGTAGGIKTTTLATLFLTSKSSIKNTKDMNVYKRRLPESLIRKSVTIFIISISWVILITFILTISESNLEFLDLLYEVTSSFATVGITRGITTSLSNFGKLLIAISMLFGKLGPLTIMFAFTSKDHPKTFREAEESIIVG